MYTLYCHINTINHKRYVGITKRKPEYRWNNGEGYVGCTAFYRAIKKYGCIKGVYLGIKRLLKCHPCAKGGYDPLN